jgi:pimeloyl-ACP methyl ester carboxylesterase
VGSTDTGRHSCSPGGPTDGETGWLALLPSLSQHLTCFTINTRGRGPSGDHPDHSRAKIVEDIVAFVESIGGSVRLFGHSAGGAHALEAAATTPAVRALALYEPTLVEFAEPDLRARFDDALVRVRQAVDVGRPADAAQVLLEDLALANEEELALLAEVGAAEQMASRVPVVLEGGDAVRSAPADRPVATGRGRSARAAAARRTHPPVLRAGGTPGRGPARRLPPP